MLKTERREQGILARGYALGRLDELGEETLSRRRYDVAEWFVRYYLNNRGLGITATWERFWTSQTVQEHVHGITQQRQKDDPELVALLAQEEAVDRQIYGR